MEKIEKQRRGVVLRAALGARDDGYTHMFSIVKQFKSTTYCHCVAVGSIIAAGKWGRAPRTQFKNGSHGPYGIPHRLLPAGAINKLAAIKKYCNQPG
jgi:hypothetical protein